MHADRTEVEARIDHVLDTRVRPAVHTARAPLTVTAWEVPGEPVGVDEAMAADYVPFEVGSTWGPPWSTTWFRVSGKVPAEWSGLQVEAVIDIGFLGAGPGFQAEALVHDPAGVPVKALNPANQYVPVPASAVGSTVEWLVEAAANPEVQGVGAGTSTTDLGSRDAGLLGPAYRFARADVAVLDPEVYGLTLDMDVLRELMHALDQTDPRRHEIRVALDRACDALDPGDVPATAVAARAELAVVLSRPANASAHIVHAVGHAHIDTAWLWPMRETQRKVSRTFANVVALAAAEPGMVFACSQAQQYAWVKDRWPETYKRMQDAAGNGSWVPVGGMWVESDGNLPGGEALARQFVHGQRFFTEEFGAPCTGAWLPDSFGYTAAYPQLAALAGLRWFLTQKISWNRTNRFPHHTFWWEGIDGTRIFTHFPPVDTYNAAVTGDELLHSVRNHADSGRATTSLLPYGYGDGGGGPTREMLERVKRFADLEGAPRVIHSTPDAFFDAALAEYPDAPVWNGELYLEMHRGTYTSQARGKAGNRRSEHLLREVELWWTAATVHLGAVYPHEVLDRLWKHVLLLQFHDILPGSSIHWVHEEAEADYERITAELEALLTDAQRLLAPAGGAVFSASPRGATSVLDVDGAGVAARGRQLVTVRPSAVVPLTDSLDAAGRVHTVPVTVTGSPAESEVVLDNGLLRVTVDADGLLASVRDLRADREVLAPGSRGNLLRLHTDFPNTYDAWDVDRSYLNRYTDLVEADSVEVRVDHPLAAEVVVTRSFGSSRIEQTLTLSAGDPGLRIRTVTDWHERQKFLKAGFDLDVRAPRSTAEIQFGSVERATHTNTSWDHARFEASAHRWVHVGETGYGVALLTDSTYGYDASTAARTGGGTTTSLRVSLLRAPLSPDPQADQGRHVQTYTLLPGAGIVDAVAGGYALNLPPRVVTGSARPGLVPAVPLVDTTGDAVVVEAVKMADDRSGDVVVRLYESLGGHADTLLLAGFAVASARSEDLLEQPLAGADPLMVAADGTIALSLRPFQVLTIRLTRAG